VADQSSTTRARRIGGDCRSAAQVALTERRLSLAAALLAASELLAQAVLQTERLDRQRESERARAAGAESLDEA
jgi:hypothetical protein